MTWRVASLVFFLIVCLSLSSIIPEQAVRDIAPGEELVVECSDDNYDGGNYFLSRYNASEDSVFCLDNVRVAQSDIPGAGLGLKATKALAAGKNILSTPVAPVDAQEMGVVMGVLEPGRRVSPKQLLLNYCFGHKQSQLYLCPVGALANYINNGGTTTAGPNAQIRWHQTTLTEEEQAALGRREEYHHYDELKSWPYKRVATTHGMGLVIDIVATRPIAPGEEILMDYGSDWLASYNHHVKRWKTGEASYINAEDYVKSEDPHTLIRTIMEQRNNPYPKNIESFCFYEPLDPQSLSLDDAVMGGTDYRSYDEKDLNDCFRPCRILERSGSDDGDVTYTVEFDMDHNQRVLLYCTIDSDIIMTGVPPKAIRLVEATYTAAA